MDHRPGEGSGAGGEPVPDPGVPGGAAPEPGLAGFVKGGVWDSAVPSAALAAALEGAAGEGWRCEGGSREEIVGAVRAAAALESQACAAKLGLIRAAIRQDDDGLGGEYHGDLPDEWSKSLTTDVALALAMSPVSAEKLMQTAWDLGALLPGIGRLLEDGTLTYTKARVINDALELLSEPDKAAAEAMIADRLAGKTYGQVEKIAAQAAITVDPGLAERTREHAERNRARVVLKRERSGAASLLGCDLPPAETLAAHAATCARAQVYQDSGAFPGVLTDQLRAMAYLDLINEISAEARIAEGPPKEGLGAPGEAAFRNDPEPDDSGPPAPEASGGSDCPCDECDGRCAPPADDGDSNDGGPDEYGPGGGPGDDEPDGDEPNGDEPDDGPGDDGPDDGGPGDGGAGDCGCRACNGRCPPADDHDDPGPGPARLRPPTGPPSPQPSPPQPPPPPAPPPRSPWSTSPSSPAPPRLTDLTVPLATLLGPPTRPGESHGFGPLDPALCRALAALAAASPHTTACVTVTDPNGYAIGHGCLTTGRRRAPLPGAPDPPLTALPARLNLTITAARLTQATRASRATPPARPRAPVRLGAGQKRRPPTRPDRRATRPGAAPGSSPCPAACSTRCPSSPSPPTPATTGGNHTPTRPTTCSATWSRSATPSAPCRPAPATQGKATSSTRSRTTRAAGRAAATPAHAAAPATRSNNHPAGKSPSPNPAGTNGKPPAAGPTPKNPNDTPPD